MTRDPNISDETLIAYLDGELDEAGMAAVDAALATDATLVDRLEAHAALADRVRAAYAPVIDEPLPASLTGLIQPASAPGSAPESAPESGKVVDLAARRKLRPPYEWWGAIAACLVVGVMIFGQEFRPAIGDPIGRDMTARGQLAKALTVRTSSGGGRKGVAIGLTFKDHDGRYCRTFALEGMSGLACREGKAWKLEVAVRQPASAKSEYRMAASVTATPVLNRVDELIAGEALDAAQEKKALASGWR